MLFLILQFLEEILALKGSRVSKERLVLKERLARKVRTSTLQAQSQMW
jgi:hypothetical protein